MTEYVLMKLTAGEEIVSEVVSSEDGTYVLKSPRMLVMQQTQNGMGIAILPYSAGAPDGEHTVKESAIQSTCPVPEKLERAYITNTSNIQIVSG